MATIIDSEAWFCVDCGVQIANGDLSGCEDAEAHLAAMDAESALNPGHRVVSGCPEGESCDFAEDEGHECRYDRDFSSARCDGCGTYLAGHRFAGVIFQL